MGPKTIQAVIIIVAVVAVIALVGAIGASIKVGAFQLGVQAGK